MHHTFMTDKINFDDLTIGQLRKLTDHFLKEHKNFKTAQEMLEDRANVGK